MSLKAFSNPEAILNIYDSPDVTDHLQLHRLTLNESSSSIIMDLTLNAKPSNPPSRWNAKTNASIITLQLSGIKRLLLCKWAPEAPPRVTLAKNEEGLVIVNTSDDSFRVICEYAYVLNINGYIRDNTSS